MAFFASLYFDIFVEDVYVAANGTREQCWKGSLVTL